MVQSNLLMRSGDIFVKSKPKNPKSNIFWCLRQKKGIKLEEPNVNLCNVYLLKAKSALNMLNAALDLNEVDWIATTAYYSRYFAFYALLQKCGIKSEIHDCTISLMHFLFVNENILEHQFYREMESAKGLRIDFQYYVTGELDIARINLGALKAGPFVLRLQQAIEKITDSQIQSIRNKLIAVNS